jgi:peptidase M23-like protein
MRLPEIAGNRRRTGILRHLLAGMIFACLLLAGTAQAQTSAPASGLEGTWAGVLGGQLHLIVTIKNSGDGGFEGTLNSVDQHATLAMSNINLKDDSVRFEVPRVGGVYEGKLNKSADVIFGSWTQTGIMAQPLDLQRSAKPEEAPAAVRPPPAHTPKPLIAEFNAVPSITPQVFKADGKWHLVYELHVANMHRWDYRFTRIDVVGGDAAQKTLASFSGSDLDGMFAHPGNSKAEKISKLVPGEFGIVYLWVNFDRLEDVPATIAHRISVKIGDYPDDLTVVTPAIAVDRDPVPVIASPLVGDNFVAANGPSNTSVHRVIVIPVNGHAYAAQRFAIDWVELYPDGKTYQGDALDNKNYRIYGHEIHSVAEGTVTEIKDGIPQNVPNAKEMAVPITLETLGGNHVIVDIGGGRYAFYAHMQPGSVRVKVGDKVTPGQVLGLVGNTGNSSEPHLHFHICDLSSEIACEGLPYALISYELLGKGDNWKPSDPHPAAVKHELEIPTEDEIASFLEPTK